MPYVGGSVARREDRRLVTGRGAFVDDEPFVGLHAVFVRSPHARARIVRIDPAAALAAPGVTAVITAQDLAIAPRGQRGPDYYGIPLPNGHPEAHPIAVRPLASSAVSYVGEAVALVLASDVYMARDAADLVTVEYEPLNAVVDVDEAMSGAPYVHEGLGTNVAFRYMMGSTDVEDAMAAYERVVRIRIPYRRLSAVPIEPRTLVARYDDFTDGLVVHAGTQEPHHLRMALAATIGIAENKLRVITRDVGGGFGPKGIVYPDEAAIAYIAWTRRCAIKWIETRSENLRVMAQGRGQTHELTLGVDRDGRLRALDVAITSDLGAYIPMAGAIPGLLTAVLATGPYRIETARVRVQGAYTNKAPTAPYRGAGRPEAVFGLERAVDMAARSLGLDPAELRRRNFIAADQLPYRTPTGCVYDSGDYRAAFEKALRIIDYDGFRQAQPSTRAAGRYVGIGICSMVHTAAPEAWESGTVRVDASGRVTVLTGSSSHGQGHHTAFAQIVADVLTLPIEAIEVIHGDTAAVAAGVGTFGSRSAAMGGSAAYVAACALREKMLQIAAAIMGRSPSAVRLHGACFSVGDDGPSLTFEQVAIAAHTANFAMPAGLSPGLESTEFFSAKDMVYPFGTHVCTVEVDRNTGRVTILRFVAVDDCGNLINPMLVAGQLHGGIAQGIGQALLEEIVYDEAGQLATGTLMDYAIPKSTDVPDYELDYTISPTPLNPLGAKGIGEAGTIGAPAAVVNAVVDALAPLGVADVEMPLTAPKLWAIMQAARSVRPVQAEPSP